MKCELEAKSGPIRAKAARAIALTLLLCVSGTAARAHESTQKQSGPGSHSSKLPSSTTSVTPPSITAQPASVTVSAGGTASFSVAASGTAPLAYQWYENGTVIGGATSSTFRISATTTSYNGTEFAATVSNSGGTATSKAALLTVEQSGSGSHSKKVRSSISATTTVTPPSITVQPASVTLLAGGTASFSVAAAGTAPLAYQWYENGIAIGGATSSTYTISAATSYNGARFTATVSNSGGTATSNAALLTVNPVTLLLSASSTNLAFGNVNLSSSSSQNVMLTNAGNSSVTISNVSAAGAGFNAGGGLSGITLTPGQTATLIASFAPATAGSVSGGIQVTSNASNSPATIALSGTGVAPVTHSVFLSWAPSSSVVGYNVYSSPISGGPYDKLTASPVTTTNYTDGSASAAQTYYYVVTAVSSTNVESGYSAQVSAVVP